MKSKSWKSPEPPTLEQLEAELGREKYKRRYKRVLRSTVYTLVVVAAVAVLVATIWMPVLQIYGSSMTPTLKEGDIVLSVKGSGFEPGDLVAFYLGNKILVKRCIPAVPRSAAFPMSKSSEGSYSGSGLCRTSAR